MREGMPGSLQGVPTRKPQINDAIPAIAPKWLKHDRQVSVILLTCLFLAIWSKLGGHIRVQGGIIKNYLKSL